MNRDQLPLLSLTLSETRRKVPPPVLSLTLACALCPAVMTGCANIKETLRVEGRMFVKVPPQKVPQGKSQPREVIKHEQWNFQHVLEAPDNQYEAGDWYMVWHDDGRDRTRHILFTTRGWRKARKLAPDIVEATHAALKVWPTVLEPSPVFKATKRRGNKKVRTAPPEDGIAELGGLQQRAWPAVREGGKLQPAWHLGQEYSQLAAARKRVRAKTGSAGAGIRVAILDNGFDNRIAGLPQHLEQQPAFDAIGTLQKAAGRTQVRPGDLHSAHGTATLGVLAGGSIQIDGRNPKVQSWTGEIGGVPDAKIFPMAVAPWVASPTTANLAYAIDEASRVQKCDVISMSHGGAPSRMWVDAVNAAYDRGTAMFAATADYVNLPLLDFGIGVPSATVYPAAFRRVMGVGGVTATRTSYGKTDPARPLFGSGWYMRASYGPDGTAWTRNREKRMNPEDKTLDVKRLHAHPISAWAPNITTQRPAKKDGTHQHRVELNHGGASAATPQAAAAAALWLAYHRDEFEKHGRPLRKDRQWQKVQAVYNALLYSAERPAEWSGGGRKENQKPDLFFGAGFLRAADALDVSYAKALSLKGETLLGKKAPQDFYDGNRSMYRILKLRLPDRADAKERLYALPDKEERALPQDFRKSLETVHYNMVLSEVWRQGGLPVQKKDPNLPAASFWRRIFGRVLRDRASLKAEAHHRTEKSLRGGR